jgi:hypothetical protein
MTDARALRDPIDPPAAPSVRGAPDGWAACEASLEEHGSTPLPEALRLAAEALRVADVSELERSCLQRRFDRKFLLSLERAPALLAALAGDYRVVLAGQARFARYDTQYFDTAGLRCFHDHRRRRLPRSKVRVRHYVDREFSVFEIKTKTARGDTGKSRWDRDGTSLAMTDSEQALVREHAPSLRDGGPLLAQARTVFRRLMLVSARSVERATLDFELLLARGARTRSVPFVVVEVKDSGRVAHSPLVLALRSAGARMQSFSKYSAAVAALGDERITTLKPLVTALSRGPR